MRHISDKAPAPAGQGELVERMLSGSQAKTAFALRQNLERMLAGSSPLVLKTFTDGAGNTREAWTATRPECLNCAAFLTLTVGDEWTAASARANRASADRAAFAAGVKAATAAQLVRVARCLGWRGKVKGQKPADRAAALAKRAAVAGRRADEARRVAALVPDDGATHFVQVWDAGEASRRINNLNRRVLSSIFERAIIVTERHKNRAIHFHVVGVLRGRPDIRSGFDFDAFRAARNARAAGRVNRTAESRYKLAAAPELSALWAQLRETLPKYHFGRAELTPIEKTGEAVAAYVSKYVEKNVCQRLPSDKRKKLVRYLGDWSTVGEVVRPAAFADRISAIEAAAADRRQITVWGQIPAGVWKLRANDFGWASRRAWAWWSKCGEVAGLMGWQCAEKTASAIGPRWAWKVSTLWREVCGDDLHPGFPGWEWTHRRRLRQGLIEHGEAWGRANGAALSAVKVFQFNADRLFDWEHEGQHSFEPWTGATAEDLDWRPRQKMVWRAPARGGFGPVVDCNDIFRRRS